MLVTVGRRLSSSAMAMAGQWRELPAPLDIDTPSTPSTSPIPRPPRSSSLTPTSSPQHLFHSLPASPLHSPSPQCTRRLTYNDDDDDDDDSHDGLAYLAPLPGDDDDAASPLTPPTSHHSSMFEAPRDDAFRTPPSTTSMAPRQSTPTPPDDDNSEESLATHIRAVYARLDRTGVQDDGYAPGVERTRERRGRGLSSPLFVRGSQLIAATMTFPGADGGDTMDRRQEEVLKNTDRYGFFEASHPASYGNGSMPRVTTLVAESFKKVPTNRIRVDSKRRKSSFSSSRKSVASVTGPTTSNNGSISTDPDHFVPPPKSNLSELARSSHDTPKVTEKEIERDQKWNSMMSSGTTRDKSSIVQNQNFQLGEEYCSKGSKRNQFRNRCYKGIPDRWRRVAWENMMREKSKHVDPNSILSQCDNQLLMERYLDFKSRNSEHDIQIDLDVPRTISGHVLFHTRYGKGQRNLYYVLHSFSLHCSECGYCQGMGPIAATFLSYYEAEAAYISMLRLHDVYGLHEIFQPGFPGVRRCFYVQEKLVEALMPDVYAALSTQMISPSAYATKWYITLFSNTITFSSQLRLWDAFFLDGIDVLIVASVSIIWSFRQRLSLSFASFECMLTLLSCYFFIEDEDSWMKWILKTLGRKDVRESMQFWKKEWDGFVEDGTAKNYIL